VYGAKFILSIQLVKIHPKERLATASEQNLASSRAKKVGEHIHSETGVYHNRRLKGEI
jgi:hypothetical protein